MALDRRKLWVGFVGLWAGHLCFAAVEGATNLDGQAGVSAKRGSPSQNTLDTAKVNSVAGGFQRDSRSDKFLTEPGFGRKTGASSQVEGLSDSHADGATTRVDLRGMEDGRLKAKPKVAQNSEGGKGVSNLLETEVQNLKGEPNQTTKLAKEEQKDNAQQGVTQRVAWKSTAEATRGNKGVTTGVGERKSGPKKSQRSGKVLPAPEPNGKGLGEVLQQATTGLVGHHDEPKRGQSQAKVSPGPEEVAGQGELSRGTTKSLGELTTEEHTEENGNGKGQDTVLEEEGISSQKGQAGLASKVQADPHVHDHQLNESGGKAPANDPGNVRFSGQRSGGTRKGADQQSGGKVVWSCTGNAVTPAPGSAERSTTVPPAEPGESGPKCRILSEGSDQSKTEEADDVTPPLKRIELPKRENRRPCTGILLNEYCYVIKSRASTWRRAVKSCRKMNASLAVVKKKPVYDHIMELINHRVKKFYWIGLNYSTRLGLMKWIDNEELASSEYWSANVVLEEQPNSTGCFGINTTTRHLHPVQCRRKYPFICEYNVNLHGARCRERPVARTRRLVGEADTVDMLNERPHPVPTRRRGAFALIQKVNKESGLLHNLHQIDIMLTKEQEEVLETGGDPSTVHNFFRFKTAIPTAGELERFYWWHARRRSRRSVVAGDENLWPNGAVAYAFDITTTEEERKIIRQTFQLFQSKSCIRFVARTHEDDYLFISTKDTSCRSLVGRVGGLQQLFIGRESPNGKGCFDSPGSIQHEILHALGFWHEHMRPDRDDFVKLNRKNIDPVGMENFAKRPRSITNGFQYDYGSIMHYPPNAFALDPNIPTIVPIRHTDQEIGQRESMSDMDLMELNRVYGCNNVPINGHWGSWAEWSRCSVTCGGGTQTRQRSCDTPEPSNGGRGCSGKRQQSRFCKTEECPVSDIMYRWLGCWRDAGYPELLTLMEGLSGHLDGDYRVRAHPIKKCALVAKDYNSPMFALRSYGRCYILTDSVVDYYRSMGPSDGCGPEGTGGTEEIDAYMIGNDPVYGQWSIWSDYSACSATCGGGRRTRSRKCTDPAPSDEKHKCQGHSAEESSCSSGHCPVNGAWSLWSPWSSCVTSPDSNSSYRYRTRSCDQPPPAHGGAQCPGEKYDVDMCKHEDGPIGVKPGDGGNSPCRGNKSSGTVQYSCGGVPPVTKKQPLYCIIVLSPDKKAVDYPNLGCNSDDVTDHVGNTAHIEITEPSQKMDFKPSNAV